MYANLSVNFQIKSRQVSTDTLTVTRTNIFHSEFLISPGSWRKFGGRAVQKRV